MEKFQEYLDVENSGLRFSQSPTSYIFMLDSVIFLLKVHNSVKAKKSENSSACRHQKYIYKNVHKMQHLLNFVRRRQLIDLFNLIGTAFPTWIPHLREHQMTWLL